MTELSQANLVIYASDNGRDGWQPVLPAEVPAWVKSPDNIARLVAGEMCMKADEGPDGSLWYRAERFPSVAESLAGINWAYQINTAVVN